MKLDTNIVRMRPNSDTWLVLLNVFITKESIQQVVIGAVRVQFLMYAPAVFCFGHGEAPERFHIPVALLVLNAIKHESVSGRIPSSHNWNSVSKGISFNLGGRNLI